ncbi:MAG: LysM peptidoglycan-binding domain-containing protein [Firmicutes bacterium]|nr:LysM peptidoglycan-binding domain-containing protein [Bacillota bacterium]
MEVNLRPADYVGRRVFYLPRFFKLFLVVSYLLALFVLPGGQLLLNEQLEAEAEALSATLESGRAEADRIRAALDAGNRLLLESKRLEEQLALRYRWSAVLRELEQAAAMSAVTLSEFFWQQDHANLRVHAANLREAGQWREAVEKTASFEEARLQSIDMAEGGFSVVLTAKVVRDAVLPNGPAEPLPIQKPADETPQPVDLPPEPPQPEVGLEQAKPADLVPEVYIVRRTDSLSKIADKFGFTLEELLAVNPQIKNPRLIISGQRINLPDDLPAGN